MENMENKVKENYYIYFNGLLELARNWKKFAKYLKFHKELAVDINKSITKLPKDFQNVEYVKLICLTDFPEINILWEDQRQWYFSFLTAIKTLKESDLFITTSISIKDRYASGIYSRYGRDFILKVEENGQEKFVYFSLAELDDREQVDDFWIRFYRF